MPFTLERLKSQRRATENYPPSEHKQVSYCRILNSINKNFPSRPHAVSPRHLIQHRQLITTTLAERSNSHERRLIPCAYSFG